MCRRCPCTHTSSATGADLPALSCAAARWTCEFWGTEMFSGVCNRASTQQDRSLHAQPAHVYFGPHFAGTALEHHEHQSP